MEGSLNVLSLVSTVTLGLVFIVAGFAKLRDKRLFRSALQAHGYLPVLVQRLLLIALPPVEVVLGVVMISSLAFGAANVIAAGLLGVFTVTVALGSQGKGRLDCGCFGGVLGASTLRGLAARNAVLAVLAVSPIAVGAPDALLSVAVAAGTLLAAVFLVFARQILAKQSMAAAEPQANSLGRRRFLRSVGAFGGGAVLLGLMRVTGAEAACSYCGSCSQEIVWIGCSGGCCAGYWVRSRMYCDGSCYACSGWTIQQWCGATECC